MSSSALKVDYAGYDFSPSLLDIRPLQPTIGAEISGVDLSKPISDAVRDEIRAAVLKYKVIFFRDQPLTNDEHADFARNFGPLYTHPSTRHDPKITHRSTRSAPKRPRSICRT